MIRQLLLISILVLAGVLSLQAQSADSDEIDSLLEQAEERFEDHDDEGSLELYLRVLDKDDENLEALWNAAIIKVRIGFRQDDERDQGDYYQRAFELAEKALHLYPEDGHANYAWAAAQGRMTDLIGTRDRIRAAHEIEEKVSKAAEKIPDYAPVWHIWGVWHSEVANVSRAERTAARFISGGLPDGSSEKAEEYLKKAIELDGENILFRLDLARHYLEIGENGQAKELLEKIIEMEPKSKDDPGKLEEAEELLNEFS
ncbi:MAG: tetratricopeptide repeat protein [Balneolaceae bacterium]|nr:tetratricopeptide repeat protein [Balneolaceae bacterium]